MFFLHLWKIVCRRTHQEINQERTERIDYLCLGWRNEHVMEVVSRDEVMHSANWFDDDVNWYTSQVNSCSCFMLRNSTFNYFHSARTRSRLRRRRQNRYRHNHIGCVITWVSFWRISVSLFQAVKLYMVRGKPHGFSVSIHHDLLCPTPWDLCLRNVSFWRIWIYLKFNKLNSNYLNDLIIIAVIETFRNLKLDWNWNCCCWTPLVIVWIDVDYLPVQN